MGLMKFYWRGKWFRIDVCALKNKLRIPQTSAMSNDKYNYH